MKTPLGTEVDIGAGHIVLDGFPALRERGTAPPPLLGPCLLWPWSPISATAELLFSRWSQVMICSWHQTRESNTRPYPFFVHRLQRKHMSFPLSALQSHHPAEVYSNTLVAVYSSNTTAEEGICIPWLTLMSFCDFSHSALFVSTSLLRRSHRQYPHKLLTATEWGN